MMLGTSGIDSIKHGTKVLNSTLYRHLFAHINKKKVTSSYINWNNSGFPFAHKQ